MAESGTQNDSSGSMTMVADNTMIRNGGTYLAEKKAGTVRTFCYSGEYIPTARICKSVRAKINTGTATS